MTRRTCNPEPPGAWLRPLVYIGHLAFFVLQAIAWIEHGAGTDTRPITDPPRGGFFVFGLPSRSLPFKTGHLQ